MRKTISILLILIILVPGLKAFAVTSTGSILYSNDFSSIRDEYIFSYYFPNMLNANNIRLYFISSSGTVYDVVYNGSSQINGRFYFTCNGDYTIYFRSGSTVLASVSNLITTQINTPTCNSKPPDASSATDLKATAEYPPGGQKKIKYNAVSGACQYKLYRSVDNGLNWYTQTGWTHNTYIGEFLITDNSMYKVVALSCEGNLLDSDIITPDEIPNTETEPPPPSTGCDECENLTALLSCPAWQDYLDDLGDTISGSVPPAPNWNDVANTISQKIALRGELELFKNNLITALKNEEQDPTQPTAPAAYNPNLLDVLTDLPSTITTEINPNPADFEPDFGTPSTGAGAFIIPDPLAWVPDNSDKVGGYISDDTAAADPGYNPPTTTPGTVPTYTLTTPPTDTPPTYTLTTPPTDTPPAYTTTGTTTTAPGYNYGTTPGTIPNYIYGGATP